MIRLILDGKLAGSRNMAIDQALLQSAAVSGMATLRIYGWQPATVSLGYFQDYETREAHTPSADCPIVRRASGGGAIIHDHELTYSVALPADNEWASRNRDLFETVHQTLIETLEDMDVSGCRVYAESTPESQAAPFLCFQRRANGDVVIGEDKVIGSAQRRLKNALLQHGSVLMSRSKCAPELPGILDLVDSSNCTLKKLIDSWPKTLAHQMKWTLEPGMLTAAESESADFIESDRFNNEDWTRKR